MNIIFIIFKDRDLLKLNGCRARVIGSEIMEWPQGCDHALCRLQKKVGFVLLFSLSCPFERFIELAPVLGMPLANMALEVRCLLVLLVAEHVWTFVQVLGLVRQLVSDELDVISELFVADGAGEVALGHALEPVLAILRDVGRDGNVVPVKADPILNFRQRDVFRGGVEIRVRHVVLKDIFETAWDLDFHLIELGVASVRSGRICS